LCNNFLQWVQAILLREFELSSVCRSPHQAKTC
jgi:hypothetical protein